MAGRCDNQGALGLVLSVDVVECYIVDWRRAGYGDKRDVFVGEEDGFFFEMEEQRLERINPDNINTTDEAGLGGVGGW